MPTSTKYCMAITSQINCPLYMKGEHLLLSDSALLLPAGKATCLILARDVTEILLQLDADSSVASEEHCFSCSGCQGIIKFKHISAPDDRDRQPPPKEIGFSGHLQTLPPEELLQTLNVNQKTGVLFFTFPETHASVIFSNGAVMSAIHGEKKNAEGFFSILAERNGFFQFAESIANITKKDATPIGDFMNLLMEGLQKIDETEK